jgi:hypothetical protein
MIDPIQCPSDHVVSQPKREQGARMFRTPALVAAACVSTAASYIIYEVISMLAAISSIFGSLATGIAGSAPPPKPKPPYGPLGFALILSPWLVFAAVAALRWIWWTRKTLADQVDARRAR